MERFAIDSFLKGEASRLDFFALNQAEIRAGQYRYVRDFVQEKAEREHLDVGEIRILPSTFIGGVRHMKQAYQDAMAIVGKYGKPDLFITVTCNPKWREIAANIYKGQPGKQGQTPKDRPDIVARVFQEKLKGICKDIQQGQVFGKVVARIHVIEFQKRGLPHAHMLLILADDDKPKTAAEYDLIVCAELPDKEKNPALFKTITSSMIHGPCGDMNKASPCMDAGHCTKDYPKPFAEETLAVLGDFPLYRRRDDGKTFTIQKKDGPLTVDNRWVVPYNPFLCAKYDAHINVEIVASLASVKYLFSYVYKGHDCANIKVSTGTSSTATRGRVEWDEIQSYMDSRYLCAIESMWRIFKFPMTYRSHAVIRLPCEMRDQHYLHFKPGREREALEKAYGRSTKLTAWFNLNKVDDFARSLNYRQIPEYYVWHDKTGIWTRRKKNEEVIGRIYTVSFREIERYCLRLLVLNIKGATSFENLRTVTKDDITVEYPTFKGNFYSISLPL